MKLLFTNNLNQKQLFDILVLEKQHNYSILPDEEDYEDNTIQYYLAYENASLMGVLTLAEAFDGYEVNSLVDFAYRKQGVFKALLTLVKDKLPEEMLYFTYSETSATFDYRKASFCGELLYQDYFMTLDKADYNRLSDIDPLYYIECKDDCYTLKKSTKGRHCIIGSMNLDYESNFTNVWGVEIRAKYRNKGLGHIIMTMVLDEYYKANNNQLLLHVRSDNEPAVRLYKRLGFKIHKTLDNYAI